MTERDPISTPALPGGLPFDASQIQFTPAGAGAVARSVQDDLRELGVSVKRFGAKGDGLTDDTAAIRLAIAASVLDATNIGWAIYFPAGVYVITDELDLYTNNATTLLPGHRNGLKLFGDGTGASVILWKGTQAAGPLTAAQYADYGTYPESGRKAMIRLGTATQLNAVDVTLQDIRLVDGKFAGLGGGITNPTFGIRGGGFAGNVVHRPVLIRVQVLGCRAPLRLGSDNISDDVSQTYAEDCLFTSDVGDGAVTEQWNNKTQDNLFVRCVLYDNATNASTKTSLAFHQNVHNAIYDNTEFLISATAQTTQKYGISIVAAANALGGSVTARSCFHQGSVAFATAGTQHKIVLEAPMIQLQDADAVVGNNFVNLFDVNSISIKNATYFGSRTVKSIGRMGYVNINGFTTFGSNPLKTWITSNASYWQDQRIEWENNDVGILDELWYGGVDVTGGATPSGKKTLTARALNDMVSINRVPDLLSVANPTFELEYVRPTVPSTSALITPATGNLNVSASYVNGRRAWTPTTTNYNAAAYAKTETFAECQPFEMLILEADMCITVAAGVSGSADSFGVALQFYDNTGAGIASADLFTGIKLDGSAFTLSDADKIMTLPITFDGKWMTFTSGPIPVPSTAFSVGVEVLFQNNTASTANDGKYTTVGWTSPRVYAGPLLRKRLSRAWSSRPVSAVAPAAGFWKLGEVVKHSSPSVGNPKGWVCTVTGSPGTFVSEGNL